ncbi:MAG: DUF1573 domain-containing protein [Tissierellaceae bacterium]|jgi:hypothetical protein|nr:DUF1573 domain-containing protein [Tissierellia bacterium]
MTKIKDNSQIDLCTDFQDQASQALIRHKSILDIMAKVDQYSSRINRAVVKSATSCGCIEIHATKQNFDGQTYEDLADKVSSHVHGEICDNCRDVIEEEIGSFMFFIASLCNTLDLDLKDIIMKEYERNKTLGIYSLK